jgi:hypothetical protein
MEIIIHVLHLAVVLLFIAMALAPLASKSYPLARNAKYTDRLRSASPHAGKEEAS